MSDAPTTITIDARRLRREITHLAIRVGEIFDNDSISPREKHEQGDAARDEAFSRCLGFNSE